MSVLDNIVAATRARLETEPPPDLAAARRAAAARPPHRFEKALRRDGVVLAREAIASGRAMGKLEELVRVTQELA